MAARVRTDLVSLIGELSAPDLDLVADLAHLLGRLSGGTSSSRHARPLPVSASRAICGYDLVLTLIPFTRDPERDARVLEAQRLTPQERLRNLLVQIEQE